MSPVLIRLLVLIAGYIFGMFLAGHFLGKLMHFDLTKMGSGNVGATNALRCLGLKTALLVFFLDALKAFLPVFIVGQIFKNDSLRYIYMVYTVLGVILGNDYPVILGFKGGKGVAATSGWGIGMNPLIWALAMALFFGLAFATRYVSLASIIATVCSTSAFIAFACTGIIPVPQEALAEFIIVIILVELLLIFAHRGNIVRLIQGKENRFGSKKEGKK